MSVIQLVYSSRNHAAAEPDRSQLELLRSILAVSRRNNARDGITGFLLFDRAWFFQILEGERQSVTASYGRIEKDPRHSEVRLMSTRDIRRRSFPRWSMGAALRTLDQQEIYLRHGICGALDPNRVTAPTILSLAMDLQDDEIASEEKAARTPA